MAGVTVVGTPVPRAEGSDTVAGIGDSANNSAPAAVANAVADAAGVRLFGLPITAECGSLLAIDRRLDKKVRRVSPRVVGNEIGRNWNRLRFGP